jgi:hypothetical protein
VVLGVAVVVVVGAFVASLTVDRGAAAVPPKSPHEVRWPKDLALIAHRVEQIRGLRFRHAVPVRYVHTSSDASPPAPLSDRARAALSRLIEPYVAFGLVDGQSDVATLTSGGSGSILGAYSTESHRIRIFVRPHTALGDEVVAHELTHALEDQHFPMKDRPEIHSSTQSVANGAVVEGSASLVERRYVAKYPTLSALPGAHPLADRNAEAYDRSWEFFEALAVAPYSLGPQYVKAILGRGDLTWDRIVAYPPLSDVVIVDPLVTPGSLWRTESPIATGGFTPGTEPAPTALEVYLLLASRVGAAAALDVVTHSSGATLAMYPRDGRTCVDLALVTMSPDDPSLTGTMDRWVAAAGPENAARSSVPSSASRGVDFRGSVTLTPRAGSLILTSCRGVAVTSYGSFVIAEAQLVARNAAIADALHHGQDEATAACIGRAVLADEPYHRTLQRTFDRYRDLPGQALTRVAHRAAMACGATA